jgi:nucleoside-diphosphate-sugar epimerase
MPWCLRYQLRRQAESAVRWAITGAGGYIGSELARALVRQGDTVRGLIRSNARSVEGVEVVQGDVRDHAAVSQLVDGADVVVHLAAFVHRRAASRRAKQECYSINVDGTQAVVDAMKKRAPSAFLVYVSSSNVYADAGEPQGESAQTIPRTYYGETKLEAEKLVLEASANGTRATVLRPAMVFGPGAPGNLRRLVRFIRRGRMFLIGNGDNVKSLAPIETVIASIVAVARERELTQGEIYNVARGERSMRDIAALIADELSVVLRATQLPLWPLRAAGRIVDAASVWTSLPSIAQMVTTYASSSVISTAKLQQLQTFRDDTDLDDALRTTVRAISASQ